MSRKEDTFLLVSLEENKAKKLAQVINSDACRKILNHLAKKESTESEISKDLNLPISTVHYNLKHLVDAGLVKTEEFHYSAKGKEVNHYALANKYIIIAPNVTEGLSQKLRKILPAALSIVVIAGIMEIVNVFKDGSVMRNLATPPMDVLDKAAEVTAVAQEGAAQATSGIAEAAFSEATNISADVAITNVPEVAASQPMALWFFVGAMSALTLYFIYDLLKERWKK